MSFAEEQKHKQLIKALNGISKELHEVRMSMDSLRQAVIHLGPAPEEQPEPAPLNDIEDSVEAVGWYCKFDSLTWSTIFTCKNCNTDTGLHGKLDRVPQINCSGCGRPFSQADRELFL